MELFHKLWARRDFTLPQFEPTPLEFDPEADAAGAERPGAPPPDPASELRNALAELRRSLA